MDDLGDLISDWPVDRAAVGVTRSTGTVGLGGDDRWVTRIASVSKLLVGWATLVAIEEETVTLDDPAGPQGATVEHLLAHASGLAFDSDRMLTVPGRRRIYSNTGIEILCRFLTERSGMEFGEYLRLGVFDPLGMTDSRLEGSPAHGVHSSVRDLLAFAREVMTPTLVSAATMDQAIRTHFPSLPGVLPGVGSFDPNPWGLTFEVRGEKWPHWTGSSNSPRTIGHFGGAGTFLWLDPEVGLAAVALTNRDFDKWAMDVWPKFSDSVLERYA